MENKVGLNDGENSANVKTTKSILDFTQEGINLPIPKELTEIVISKYKDTQGIPEVIGEEVLRKAVARIFQNKYFSSFDYRHEIIINTGLSAAIYTILLSTVKEGNEVVIFEPYPYNLSEIVRFTGARAVYIPLKESDSGIDWQEVQRAIGPSTKLIVIQNPHPITGRVLTPDDFENLQKLINGTRIKVICDESLSETIFSEETTSGIAFFPKLLSSTFIVGSFAQKIGFAGWDMGFCIAPEEQMESYLRVHRILNSPVSKPLQLALAEYFDASNPIFKHLELLKNNSKLVFDMLSASKFKVQMPQAGCHVTIDYSDASELKDVEFVSLLESNYGVMLAPVSQFYHDRQCHKRLIMNIAHPTQVIEKALKKLAKV